MPDYICAWSNCGNAESGSFGMKADSGYGIDQQSDKSQLHINKVTSVRQAMQAVTSACNAEGHSKYLDPNANGSHVWLQCRT